MKLEIRENMYVRFKDKRGIEYIRKIVKIPEDNRYASLYLDKEANYSHGLSPKNIIKASYNIIDILEIGDYVNGDKIFNIDDCKGAMRQFYYDYENPNDDVGHWEEEIKSVITHEQMEQMAYKVGE